MTTLDRAQLDDLTDGRIVTGARAVAVGLADQTGGIRDAFRVAKSMAKIERARLVKYYPEGGERPRSAYAQSDTPRAGETEINLLQIRGGALGTAGMGGAYYLWLPPG